MLARVRSLLSQRPFFWRLRRRWTHVLFFLRKGLFRVKGWTKGKLEWSLTLGGFVLSSIIPVISALITAYVLIRLDHLLAGKPFFTQKIANPNGSDYITFLVGVSSIGGVFIGLYYAALTTVGAEIYTRLPGNIQKLLVQDHIGNIYMRLLLYTTYLPICLIIAKTLGVENVRLSIVYVAGLSCIGIVNFAVLGRRAFYFFDPTRLAETLFEELEEWIKEATYLGFKWSDTSFQFYTHRQTAYRIKALITLGETAAGESHLKGEAYTSLVESILRFLGNMKVLKHRIPTDSLWYPRVTRYQDWYLCPDQKIEIHAKTGTQIEPEQAISHNWIEEELEPIVLACFSSHIKAGAFQLSERILADIRLYVSRMAAMSQISDALDFCRRVREITLRACAGCPPVKQRIEQIRHVLYCPMDVLLNYSAQHQRFAGYLERLDEINWKVPQAIYRVEAPAHHLGRLEYMRRMIEFERLSHGNAITPDWYIKTDLLEYELGYMVKSIEALMAYHDGLSLDKNPKTEIDALISEECLSQRWERMQKLAFHLHSIGQHWNETLRSYSQSEVWKKLSEHMNKWQESLLVLRNQTIKDVTTWLFRRYSAEGTPLFTREQETVATLPDYEGQFLHIIIQSIIEMISTPDSPQQNLHAPLTILFNGAFRKRNQILQQLQDIEKERKFRIAGSGIIDLMEISGLILVAATVQKKPELRRVVTQVWSNTLRQLKENNNVDVEFFLAVDKMTHAYYLGLAHRSVVRTGWGIAVREGNRALYEQTHDPHDLFGPRDRLHGFFHNIDNGLDVFKTSYLERLQNIRAIFAKATVPSSVSSQGQQAGNTP